MKHLVVTLCDENFLDQVKVLVSSLYQNSGWEGDYMLLAHRIPEKKLKWFTDRGILVKDCKPLSGKIFPTFPSTVLAKFYLFTDEFKKWDHVIFLDGDMTVEASIDGLTKFKGVSACVDFNERPLKKQFIDEKDLKERSQKESYEELKMKYDIESPSFNSGVFVIETSGLKGDTFSDLMDLFDKYGNISLYEQSILNLHFFKRWNRLPLAYNNYNLYKRARGSLKIEPIDGVINHFILDKVWKTKNPHFYPKWKRYLGSADKIDLDNRPPAKEVWSEEEITARSDALAYKNLLPDLLANGWDYNLGQVGILIQKTNPKLYEKIQKMKGEDIE